MSLGTTKELKKSALLSLIVCYQILVLGYQGDNTIREELEMKSETFDSENKEKSAHSWRNSHRDAHFHSNALIVFEEDAEFSKEP